LFAGSKDGPDVEDCCMPTTTTPQVRFRTIGAVRIRYVDSGSSRLASLDTVPALNPSMIITGHKDPGAPDDDATQVLD
jgi:hypothetical protein